MLCFKNSSKNFKNYKFTFRPFKKIIFTFRTITSKLYLPFGFKKNLYFTFGPLKKIKMLFCLNKNVILPTREINTCFAFILVEMYYRFREITHIVYEKL